MSSSEAMVENENENESKGKNNESKLYIVDNGGCDYCNNNVCDEPVMVLCSECRKYLNGKLRRRLLVAALKKYGLVVRGDSILAKKYIRGDEDTLLEKVVNVTLEMEFFMKTTEYRELVKEFAGYYCIENGMVVGSKIEDKDEMSKIKEKARRIALDKYVRGGHDIDIVPPSLKGMAEIIALECYIDF